MSQSYGQPPNRYVNIPIDNLAEGIMHGPYPKDPENLIEQYVTNRQVLFIPDHVSDDQLRLDIASEIQYDQHSAAVEKASEDGLITPEHALFMLEKILRPWFIGRRNERDIT